MSHADFFLTPNGGVGHVWRAYCCVTCLRVCPPEPSRCDGSKVDYRGFERIMDPYQGIPLALTDVSV